MNTSITKAQYKEIAKNLPKLKILGGQLNLPQWVIDATVSYNYMAKVSHKIYRDCFVTYNINQSDEALLYVHSFKEIINYKFPLVVAMMEKACVIPTGDYSACSKLKPQIISQITSDLKDIKKVYADSLEFCGITYITDKDAPKNTTPSSDSEERNLLPNEAIIPGYTDSADVPSSDEQVMPSGACSDVIEAK